MLGGAVCPAASDIDFLFEFAKIFVIMQEPQRGFLAMQV
jgi:hypothetical protein